jgi:hypothetical protein
MRKSCSGRPSSSAIRPVGVSRIEGNAGGKASGKKLRLSISGMTFLVMVCIWKNVQCLASKYKVATSTRYHGRRFLALAPFEKRQFSQFQTYRLRQT